MPQDHQRRSAGTRCARSLRTRAYRPPAELLPERRAAHTDPLLLQDLPQHRTEHPPLAGIEPPDPLQARLDAGVALVELDLIRQNAFQQQESAPGWPPAGAPAPRL